MQHPATFNANFKSGQIVEAMARFANEQGAAMDALFKAVTARPIPKTLYHYTNADGLRGIMSSGQLWLSDAFAMNDPSEIAHGVEHARLALEEIAVAVGGRYHEFHSAFARMVVEGLPTIGRFNLCSFSTCGDDLGQWRAYGDNGRGFALGFDGAALEVAFAKESPVHAPNAAVFFMDYHEAKLKAMQFELIARARNCFDSIVTSGASGEEMTDALRRVSAQTAGYAVHIATHFKHRAYRNEREYRFLTVHSIDKALPGGKIRDSGGTAVAYSVLDWLQLRPDCLREIVIGPSADREGALALVADSLRTYYMGRTVRITDSVIPYRAR